jgi:hypothetical protein
MKKTLAALAIAGLVMAPVVVTAADMDTAPPPPRDPISTVGCGIVTIIMLPIIILGGDGPNCG